MAADQVQAFLEKVLQTQELQMELGGLFPASNGLSHGQKMQKIVELGALHGYQFSEDELRETVQLLETLKMVKSVGKNTDALTDDELDSVSGGAGSPVNDIAYSIIQLIHAANGK